MIIHINGWPGVGKFTIGSELAGTIGARFIHNHLLHDVAIACAGREDDQRWPLYETIRTAAYDVLSRKPPNEIFVMTNALCTGVIREEKAWRDVMELADARSVTLVPIVLRADTETILSRATSDNRSFMKLKDPATLRAMISEHTLQVPDLAATLELDVSELTVGEAVDNIQRHLASLKNSR